MRWLKRYKVSIYMGRTVNVRADDVSRLLARQWIPVERADIEATDRLTRAVSGPKGKGTY